MAKLAFNLLIFFFQFTCFSLFKQKQVLINFFLLIILFVLMGVYLTQPSKAVESKTLETIGLNSDYFSDKSIDLTTQSLTQVEAQKALSLLESSLIFELPITQKTYLNLSILAFYAGENEKASRFLEQARFVNPNETFFIE